MGTTPNIRVKGVSRMGYNFLWDPEIRHYAYEPKNQKEADDLFRAQGKVYRHMYFSAWLDAPKTKAEAKVEEPKAKAEAKVEEPKAKAKAKTTTKKKSAKKAVVTDNR